MPKKVNIVVPLFIICFLIATCIALVLAIFFSRIPPDDLTRSNIIAIAIRIRMYVKIHKQLPDDLSSLPKREGHSNSIKDGWGNEIKYNVVSDEIVILTSFGKDRKAGGEGSNADITGSFNPMIENDYPFIHSLSAPNLTCSRMVSIGESLKEYLRSHTQLPKDLSWLTNQEGYDNITKDDWGNEIKYTVVNGYLVTLTSFGKDGMPGGEKEDRDIELTFNVRDGRE